MMNTTVNTKVNKINKENKRKKISNLFGQKVKKSVVESESTSSRIDTANFDKSIIIDVIMATNKYLHKSKNKSVDTIKTDIKLSLKSAYKAVPKRFIEAEQAVDLLVDVLIDISKVKPSKFSKKVDVSILENTLLLGFTNLRRGKQDTLFQVTDLTKTKKQFFGCLSFGSYRTAQRYCDNMNAYYGEIDKYMVVKQNVIYDINGVNGYVSDKECVYPQEAIATFNRKAM